jgi:hypothetical protein
MERILDAALFVVILVLLVNVLIGFSLLVGYVWSWAA